MQTKIKNQNKTAGIWVIIAIIALIASAVCFYLYYAGTDEIKPAIGISEIKKELPPLEISPFARIDAMAVDGKLSNYKIPEQRNAPDKVEFSIKSNLVFKDAQTPAQLAFENPAQNSCLLATEITLAEDDRVLYRSKYIKPFQYIDTIKLDETLPKGEYKAIAYIAAVDKDTLNVIDVFEQPITIVFEN
ncbi:MAG TPA: hypothetical protein DCP97_05695 [Ruminococcaceae bacterium]|nr:hypothetical protein [Oscillospiraceae bacterium]